MSEPPLELPPLAPTALPAQTEAELRLLAPRGWLALVAVTCIGAIWLSVWLAVSVPWLGLSLVPEDGQVRIGAVAASGPSAGLPEGSRLLALRGTAGEVALDAVSLIEEPDFLPDYAAYNAFMARQSRLATLLNDTTVVLVTNVGEFLVEPGERPLAALPVVFWFQLLCGLLAGLSGVCVLVFRPGLAAARAYALTGISFLLVTFTAAVYSSRELALPGELFRTLSVLDHLGAMLFAGAFIGLLWHYPTRLGRMAVDRGLLLLYGAIWALDTLQWLPGTDWGIRLPVIAGLLLSAVFATLQWRHTRGKPVERAALKWFLFSLYFAGTSFVLGVFVAVWLGLQPFIPQGYAFGLVVFMYLGVALGIVRYRLFDLERWWVSVWLWLLAGVALIGMDLAFVYLLQVNEALALSLALALVGWLYFPLRQWLLGRLHLPGRMSVETLFPHLLRLGLASDSPHVLGRAWRDLVQEVFDPLYVAEMDTAVARPVITREGLELVLPALDEVPALGIGYPARGQRLFNADDHILAESMWALAQRAVADRRLYEQGARAERERLARDLHDDIGGRLLTLTHRTTDPALAHLARDALRELRSVVANLGAAPCRLGEVAGDWCAEAEERCAAAGLDLIWKTEAAAEAIDLGAAERLNLLRILREALSNALRHAGAKRVTVRLWVADATLHLTVADDGGGPSPALWPQGRGLANMRRRAGDLGGHIEFESLPGGAQVRLSIPVRRL